MNIKGIKPETYNLRNVRFAFASLPDEGKKAIDLAGAESGGKLVRKQSVLVFYSLRQYWMW